MSIPVTIKDTSPCNKKDMAHIFEGFQDYMIARFLFHFFPFHQQNRRVEIGNLAEQEVSL